jgi:thioredoxin-dependent peroxiredoxin
MQAPDFSLADQDNNIRRLQDYAGKWLVLYFYPEDETGGCTTEACNFRDGRDVITQLNDALVVGVSPDSVESHKKFSENHDLNFTLLSDPSHKTIEAYKSWDGEWTLRNTFIINPEGQIAKEYQGVDPKTHVGQIITDLRQLQQQA